MEVGEQKVQMRALTRSLTMDGAVVPKQIFWCSREHAQHYIQYRIAEVVGAVGPTEIQTVGPTETKKYLPEELAGLSTDSVPSSESGMDAPLSAPLVAQVSTQHRPILSVPFGKRGRRR